MTSPADEVVRDCLAVRVRLIARAITGIYDTTLEKHDVGIAQVNLLAALGKVGPCAPTLLSDALQLDRSTVSRNLGLLTKRGWVDAVSADAKGIREVALTSAGRKKIETVLPAWRNAQQQAEELLGSAGVKSLRSMANNLGQIPSD